MNVSMEKELSQKVGASQLDTLTTEQLDALIQLARYGWTRSRRKYNPEPYVYAEMLDNARQCVKRLLFPLEGELIGK